VPFLKFGRDRRGYESTFLLHAARTAGQGQPRLLYWFRTPPHVKIGRAAFDEDAIRLLEQQHPEVEFDWERILTARPPAAPEPHDVREGRPRGKLERRQGREARRAPRVPGPDWTAPIEPPVPETTPVAREEIPEPEPPREDVPEAAPVAPVSGPADPSEVAPVRRFVRVFDQQAEAHHASEPAAAERVLGAEQLTVLRARYAEIRARITARGGDPARVEALREQAERVNPDSWVTDADVEAGLATVDATLAELHRIVGRRRRRRRRRGKGPASSVENPQTAAALEQSEDGDDDDGEDGPEDDDGAL